MALLRRKRVSLDSEFMLAFVWRDQVYGPRLETMEMQFQRDCDGGLDQRE